MSGSHAALRVEVGKPEVILELTLFGGQAVNALLFVSDYPKLT
jgi:hypothetical protein